ncbi:putative gtp-binding protein [Phaeoacremonium minimum UCRPA7]|uniref:Putative gtp-binding protein n=1 Tax=Phaeoacremonium minimum (strain UCR-PA7) TaxID=1286976 RepID=R8BKS2_PHAM7|nr:putative gtp-binding protein [Phaeoacremonium minimum UCRPA7]EON99889.1 putative gtp-binding protein [Phaeoacremonium minimum UCRPA7]
MAATQLSFSLRVSSGVKTVHLLGSWDNYVGQLPLSKDKNSSKGTWKGTFRFQGTTLEAGQRYWYYYIIDGYHVSHNPSEASTTEPTTGRELNILDVPSEKKSKSSSHSSSKDKSSSKHSSSSKHHSSSKEKSSRHRSSDIPKGRPLSVSQIKAPKPVAPHATKNILNADFDEVDDLAQRFGSAGIDDDYYGEIITDFDSDTGSPVSSNGSSLSYRSDSSSPISSMSGYSTPGSDCSSCTCERYGITRKGDRVRLDCGGSRCGYGEDSSECSSSEDEYVSPASSRRNGMVVRA